MIPRSLVGAVLIYIVIHTISAGAKPPNPPSATNSIESLIETSDMHRESGAYYDALDSVAEAVRIARKEKSAAGRQQLAVLLNEEGILKGSVGQHAGAVRAFSESIELLSQDFLRRAEVELNLLRNQVDVEDHEAFLDTLTETWITSAPAENIPPSLALRFAAILIDASLLTEEPDPALLLLAGKLLQTATPKVSGQPVQESYVLGYLGRIDELQGDIDSALANSRRALLRAQQGSAPKSIYRWEWQIARLLRQTDPEAADEVYRQAVKTMSSVRTDVVAGSFRSFEQLIGPLYRDYVDFLLSQSTQASPDEQDELRQKAIDLIEQVRRAEIEDYFKEQCAATGLSTALSEVTPDAAVVYPVILDDRLELLTYLDGSLLQFTVQVTRSELDGVVTRFRQSLEENPALPMPRYTLRESRELGLLLYEWLVEPLEQTVANRDIRTLVFVPGGSLRTVPPAAFWDGKGYLVERFGLVVSPGLSLIEPRPLNTKHTRILLAGISDAVKPFKELPGVLEELQAVSKHFNEQPLLNETFTSDAITRELAHGDYAIVHLATHGLFLPQAEHSFVLTYDDRLTLDQLKSTVGLRRYSDQPLELLVLSACQTAAGDHRAALGLAGVAVQAGARSVLASLWTISDKATAETVGEFYRELTSRGATKSQALQRAQQKMLSGRRFNHPYYWSPFLLIGNWL